MAAMVNELTKLGSKWKRVETISLCMASKKARKKVNVDIETYDDHRVAMCFSLAACAGVPVNILEWGCTSKTFPHLLRCFEKHDSIVYLFTLFCCKLPQYIEFTTVLGRSRRFRAVMNSALSVNTAKASLMALN